MANDRRIKGLTIEIGGDTTQLSESLHDVNKSITSTQAQLKDVEKLLKLDPTNTEMLAQKQELLTQAIRRKSSWERGKSHRSSLPHCSVRSQQQRSN